MDHRSFRGRTCLVTGGAGFIGSNLTRALSGAGAEVIVLDDFSVGRRAHLPQSGNIRIVEADLRTYPDLESLIRPCDFVFHLAAQVGNVKSIADAAGDASINVGGSVRLFQACRDAAKLAKIVYSSSSAIFGEAQVLPIREGHPTAPASFYALSKLTAERYALMARDLWGIPVVCLRYFNVYGLPMEHNEYTGVISIFMDRIADERPLTIYGDGSAVRDYVHVSDVVQANMRAAAAGRPGEVFNVGTGQPTSVLELANAVMRAAGRRVPIEHQGERPGEVRRSLADISVIRDVLGYAPSVVLDDGLRTMWTTLHTGEGYRDA
jgi:UDP-glucose 4-epimerase